MKKLLILFLLFMAVDSFAQRKGFGALKVSSGESTSDIQTISNWKIANSIMTMTDTTLGWYMGRTTDRLGLDSGGNDSRYIHSTATSGNFYLNLTTNAQGVIGLNFAENLDAASAVSAYLSFLSGDIRLGYGTSRNSKYIGVSSAGAVTISELADGTLSAVSGVITSSSDARLKKNIRPYYGSLNVLKYIEPVRYQWKSESGIVSNRVFIGFTAQDIEWSLPDAVSEKNGRKSLDTQALLATAINAINELREENERIKERLNKLEK